MTQSPMVQRWIDDPCADQCPHVRADKSLAVRVISENDSFGPIVRYVVCGPCADRAENEEDEELHVCHDCGQSVQRQHGTFWKWYDFYAASGDEPLFLCTPCERAPKHVDRVRRDTEKAKKEDEYLASRPTNFRW